ncbi:hypothetical protein ASPWEDRAFT_105294 [Aspergillus wentii DTO 134E9]|uniref:Uncharacterized protein n=1 Tax=Aspergillus wentii DTO 134E9 TaxID=1073089 RepID=A0A1L9RWZ9_ASPWE|nr:uncharacterized protein ASPWEDRAFT_105294 [Aspergillus wentii DTO 134E9]KAI9928914.1 hypothetical protein MW887_001307 [Aspergillus wentii]OJJ39404.1 hypothetical protein ASPWEDRAFT_105294 [Aspergillus wentii DTO 134E9]
MSPMLLNRLSDGPSIVLSPQEHPFVQFPSQSKFGSSPNAFQSYAADSSSLFANGLKSHTAQSVNNASWKLSSTPNDFVAKPSRKRSRDDAAFEEAMNAPAPVMPAPAPAPKEEPIYGEGMVLLNPRTGMAVSAESQTGTWYEETAEKSAAAAPPVSSRSRGLASGSSDIPGRKSQRLDTSAPGLDDIAKSSISQRLQNPTNDDNRRGFDSVNGMSPFAPKEPLVDDATRLLGISWQRISTDDTDIAAAVRGWKKYIDNQFSAHLRDSQILMKNRALNAYLVAALPMTFTGPSNTLAFYLFSDDLIQGQLVGSTWEACLQNLRSSPITFEGAQVLRAADKPLDGPCENGSVLGSNPMETGVPLLQSLSAYPTSNFGGVGMNGGVGTGTGMEIDS